MKIGGGREEWAAGVKRRCSCFPSAICHQLCFKFRAISGSQTETPRYGPEHANKNISHWRKYNCVMKYI